MDFKLVLGTLMCLFGCTLAGVLPHHKQTGYYRSVRGVDTYRNTARNFIPRRFEIAGTLLNADGTKGRQEAPQETPSYSEQGYSQNPTNYEQTGYGIPQPTGLGYGYQQAGYTGYPQQQYYGGASYPAPVGYYQDEMQADSTVSDTKTENNDLGGKEATEFTQNDALMGQQGQAMQYYSNQANPATQQYYDATQMAGQTQATQGYYENSATARDQTASKLVPEEEEEEGQTRFKIPHLSRTNLQGLLGYTKQIYLRGGH